MMAEAVSVCILLFVPTFQSDSRHEFASAMKSASVLSICALAAKPGTAALCAYICDGHHLQDFHTAGLTGHCSFCQNLKAGTDSEPQGNVRRSLPNIVWHRVKSEMVLFAAVSFLVIAEACKAPLTQFSLELSVRLRATMSPVVCLVFLC